MSHCYYDDILDSICSLLCGIENKLDKLIEFEMDKKIRDSKPKPIDKSKKSKI